MKKKKRLLKKWKQLGFFGKMWRVVWVGCLSLWALSLVLVLLYRFVNPPLTPLMVHRFFQQVVDSDRPVRFERDYVTIDHISQNMVNAAVVAEDGLFMYHHGFDVKQLKQAYRENQRGRRVRGGSTISMQTAKNAFLPHHRSMLRKAGEAYFTTLIEWVWGKKRIMECYLNIVEFGDGIYGVEAASQHYFHHSAERLSRHEAALLAAALPAPLKRNSAHPSAYHRSYAASIQGRMAKYGRINLDAKRENLNKRHLKEMDENLFDFGLWVIQQKRKDK